MTHLFDPLAIRDMKNCVNTNNPESGGVNLAFKNQSTSQPYKQIGLADLLLMQLVVRCHAVTIAPAHGPLLAR